MEPAGYSGADLIRIKQQLDHYLDVREIIQKASGESLDLKAYEADMRHLIDTYIEADEPRIVSPFGNMGLLELIVETGIAEAIAEQLGGLRGDRNATAETIENNVRRKIIKEHLNDPAFFERMSTQLQEIIELRKARAIEYEEYLRRIAELVKNVEAGKGDDTPAKLDTPGKRAIYNNLQRERLPGDAEGVREPREHYGAGTDDEVLELALRIDEAVKKSRPDGWRGVPAREQVIKRALYDVLRSEDEVERIFLMIKAQREY